MKSGKCESISIEYNTSNGQPSGNAFINGAKYTFTASAFTYSIQGLFVDGPQASKVTVAYQCFQNVPYDGTVDVVLPNGSFVTLTLTLATGQPPGAVQ